MTMTLDRLDGVMAEPVFGRRDPDARGYFGAYGGRFVPETLVEPVAALERAYFAARTDRVVYLKDGLVEKDDLKVARV